MAGHFRELEKVYLALRISTPDAGAWCVWRDRILREKRNPYATFNQL